MRCRRPLAHSQPKNQAIPTHEQATIGGSQNVEPIMRGRDVEQISATIDDYFMGMYRSDPKLIEKAFTADAVIEGHTGGRYLRMIRSGFADFVAAQASAEKAGEPFDMKIVSVDVTEDAAMVKVSDRYIGRDFVDYLSLLKVDGRWRIVHKSWHSA